MFCYRWEDHTERPKDRPLGSMYAAASDDAIKSGPDKEDNAAAGLIALGYRLDKNGDKVWPFKKRSYQGCIIKY
jgi:hypothetical protein